MEVYRTATLKGRVTRAGAPECLATLGLLAPAVDDAEALVPIPPTVADATLVHQLEQQILEQQQAVFAMRASVAQAESVYRSLQQERGEAVQRLTGASVIAAAVEVEAQAAKSEVLTAHPGGGRPEDVLAKSLTYALEAQKRGISQRTLYQHTVRTHGPTLDYIKAATEAGVEIRTVDEVFDRLLVWDRSVALIPDKDSEHHNHALKVTDPGIVHFLASAFEHVWERAVPVVYEPDQQRPRLLTNETRMRVLRLMVDGYTDAAIAARLGISTRTVATHLKKVSDELGSNSRAQLAYLTAQSGLLECPPAADRPGGKRL
ncbi:helix-turn-helix transcriptional regulator [Streptomyces sp. MMG1121]|uniref:helix-turn-helix transcriptional regulator n=1 Tax=Streptomyces sp. MMG1121 TaxID=1415544 RepID=UPI0006C50B73|nr:LuxR C-terminal-related transcriptional regulator [Streptomyces sp. MMG1121]KOV66189.1 LuxR family transcriptional regulator [Streptomyces sp. MMG1121]